MSMIQRIRSALGGGSAAERRGLRAATLAIGLVIAFGLILLLSAVHVSSTPKFCGSCHVMSPYYESWTTSSHSHIACVECHIPPGITAEFRKKYEALAMVARYFTGTYGTNPWAEVDDTACLRCHERRLIQGREVFHNALFDHRPHLTEVRRGMKLRCTSCHSQIVQGSHMTVTTSTCVLCHFKNQTIGEGNADCTMCHETPEQVMTAANLQFDHGDVSRFGMNCTWCHEHAAEGTGNVPRERCFTCHKLTVRLEHLDDPEHLHQIHVTDHKVDCMHCHLEIQHRTEPEAVQREVAGDCSRCHGAGSHSAQRDLYAGIGAKGVPPMPSAMFAAGVRCEGCHLEDPELAAPRDSHHTRVASGGGMHVARADEVSCMACHGPGYYSIFKSWKEGADSRLAAMQRHMEQTERALHGKNDERWSEVWSDARANVALVANGRGIHNPPYAQSVLEMAHEQMNEARTAAGLKALGLPWPVARPGSQACLTCHQGIENQRGRFAGIPFAHDRHLSAAGLDCDACHRPHDERDASEIVRFDRNGCSSCHHQQVESGCATCHGGLSEREIAVDFGELAGDFSHGMHVDEMELGCTDCHDGGVHGSYTLNRDACSGCHD